MRDEIRILTPDGDSADFAVSWQPEFARIADALGRSGFGAVSHPLSRPLPGGPALALLAWGYHLDPAGWQARLDRWDVAGVRLMNPIATLRWNTNKAYLCELLDAGAPVVPSLAVDAAKPDALAAARRAFGRETLVAKPQVGACAHGASVLRPGQDAALEGPAILQPYLPSVATYGELSLMYFGGRFSHAVRKTPAAGDFRVQEEHGGTTVAVDPPAEALAAAEAALAHAPGPLLYARVDLIRDDDGRFLLMELELIEPQLFLALAPDGGAGLGQALRDTYFQAA